jgi:gas vesicle protein
VNDDVGYSKSSSLLASFVVGAMAGAAGALLFAPQSGRHTRSSVRRRLRDEVDRGRTAGARVTGRTRDWLDGASSYLGRRQEDLEPQQTRHVEASSERESEPAT